MKKLIGMVHLKTLVGYPNSNDIQEVIETAVQDAVILEEGGVDGILVENTYDDPHRKKVGEETIAAMTLIVSEIVQRVKIPVGVCVLWNDYRAALAIAKISCAKFVRVPVFTEAMVTAAGIIEANPYDVIDYRNKIDGNSIRILADVHVKHAALLANRPIEESAKDALNFGADEIIITGRYTGDAPQINDLIRVRKALPDSLINIGSGVTEDNMDNLAKYANGFIVGTYFKDKGTIDKKRVELLTKNLNIKYGKV